VIVSVVTEECPAVSVFAGLSVTTRRAGAAIPTFVGAALPRPTATRTTTFASARIVGA
jgi:hypothetical protein